MATTVIIITITMTTIVIITIIITITMTTIVMITIIITIIVIIISTWFALSPIRVARNLVGVKANPSLLLEQGCKPVIMAKMMK